MKSRFLLVILLFPLLGLAQHSPWFYEHQRIDPATLKKTLPEGGRFGYGIEAIGDLDGDGVTDWLAVGEENDSALCYVIFPDKAGVPQRVVSQPAPVFGEFTPTPEGRLGAGMAAAGDLNQDGNLEVWVGEPVGKEGPLAYGALWLWSVDSAGRVTALNRWGGRSEAFLTRLPLEGRFGADVEVLEEGRIAVAATSVPGKGKGKIFVLGHQAGANLSIQTVIGEQGEEWWEEINSNDQFGAALCSPGDLDGNGVNDLLVGAANDKSAGMGKGALHLLWLGEDGQVIQQQKLTPGDKGMKLPLNPDDRFGSALATVTPLQDSTAWVAVSAPRDDDAGKDRGAVYMMQLHKDGRFISWHKISDATYNFEGELSLKHGFGTSLAAAGDHNADGRPDLLIGGPGDADETGAAWLLMPSDWPERLKDTARWLGSFQLTAKDSALIFEKATTAEDSARILNTYNLEEYAINHLVLVLDVSASMNKPDRLPLLQQALMDLLPYMRPEDLLSVITYSGKPEVQLEAVELENRDIITETLLGLRSSGETKPGKALKDALDLAMDHYIPGGNNRIIFGTDGGFDQEDIEKSIVEIAESPVTMSVFYFGKLPANRIGEMTIIASRTGGNAAHIAGNSARGALLRESKVIGRKE